MPSSVIVLAYHHIATPGNLDLAPTVIDAYPPDFEAQMRYVAGHYNVVSSWIWCGRCARALSCRPAP